MTWTMPSETAEHERTWMSFPRPNEVLGEGDAAERGYAGWAAVAHAIARFEPVTMVVDPEARDAAGRHLSAEIEIVERPIDDFWMRDSGPTFVVDEVGRLGAIDWRFTGWGSDHPEWFARDETLAAFVAELAGARVETSLLVNEGGAIHVDGAGTVLLTATVQLDPARNRHADRRRVDAELARTIGARNPVWIERGLTRDYERMGTRGHIDMVATIPSGGTILLHAQRDAAHPDAERMREVRATLEASRTADGAEWRIVEIPAPDTLVDDEGPVDWNYVNHYVVNGGVIACGFGEPAADARARGILAEVYPGREVVTVDAREMFARGGGIHCITQQQPAVPGETGA